MTNIPFLTSHHLLNGWPARLLTLVLVSCTGTAQAVPSTYVALFIHNDADSNGNITVIEGQKVKVGWEVVANADKLLNAKDRIELLRVEDDSVVASTKRGSGKSGNVSLPVKNAAGEALYVHYRLKGEDTIVNSISHPENTGDMPLIAIAKANTSDLTVRMNVLETGRQYAVGDTGPAGGLVFYVTDGGLHGLEAAPTDLPGLPEWGCMSTDLNGAAATRVGMGARNTDDILRGCLQADTAAELTDLFSLNGYNDWYLPSKDELALMRLNIGQGSTNPVNPGNFSGIFYWSSSQFDAGNAWALRFSDALSQALNKFDTFRLARAIRSF